MTKIHFIATGACAIDNILTVPHYPEEDSKLRALSLTKRRGGNCPNLLEVLLQLVTRYTSKNGDQELPTSNVQTASIVTTPRLSLIATLPARESPQIPFISSSFGQGCGIDDKTEGRNKVGMVGVDLSSCIYRENYVEPVSSYIISSKATSSRTIVNHNELPEMSFNEFAAATQELLRPLSDNIDASGLIWFHFEGRIPTTTLQCIRYLRTHPQFEGSTAKSRLRVSVEVEKPLREGLQELALEADVIFYSRNWAEAEGYNSAKMCLQMQAKLLSRRGRRLEGNRTLVCTWGDQGACALNLPAHGVDFLTHLTHLTNTDTPFEFVESKAFIDPNLSILDTVGAGDTFIAGMLFGLLCRDQQGPSDREFTAAKVEMAPKNPNWSLKHKLEFANGLAGRKVTRNGFHELAESVHELIMDLDLHAKG